jgi:hypothetical protein
MRGKTKRLIGDPSLSFAARVVRQGRRSDRDGGSRDEARETSGQCRKRVLTLPSGFGRRR